MLPDLTSPRDQARLTDQPAGHPLLWQQAAAAASGASLQHRVPLPVIEIGTPAMWQGR